MSNLFRLGIIGTGQIAKMAHVPAALASTKVEITALVDPVVKHAQELADGYGMTSKIATTPAEVLAHVDGVVIATPNHTHRDLAVQCARAKIHCLIEKPLATTVAEAEEIVQAAEEHGIVVATGYSTRFRDAVILLHDLLRAGYFGAVKRFLYQFGTRGGWSPFSAYNLDRKSSGGGVLVVTGTHFLDRMLYWFGYPDEYALEDDARGGPEAHCVVRVHYTSGEHDFEGTIRLSKIVPLKSGFVLETEQGMVVLPTQDPEPLWFRPFSQPSLQMVVHSKTGPIFPPQKSPFQSQIENFVAACRGKEPPMVSAKQGLESVRLIENLYSCRTAMQEGNE